MNDETFLSKGFLISTDQSLLDMDVIYNYLDKDSYWSKGIPYNRLEQAVKNSLSFGVYQNKQQIGFARVITDKATFAYLADVFVLPDYRKQGLSKWLIQTIMNHADVQGLRRWSLATADAHGLYRQFGFTEIKSPEIWMQIHSPYKVAED